MLNVQLFIAVGKQNGKRLELSYVHNMLLCARSHLFVTVPTDYSEVENVKKALLTVVLKGVFSRGKENYNSFRFTICNFNTA